LYERRIGSIIQTDENQNVFFWKTNIGDSRTNGIESYIEGIILSTSALKLSVFTSTSFMDGRYTSGTLRRGNENVQLSGNKLESVPEWISRNGLQIGYKFFTAIVQFSHVSETYADAFNTEVPSSNGAVGLVPAYNLWDLNMSFKILPSLTFKFGVNNITDVSYFTKRPTGYPGGGVWSSDGRGFTATAAFRW
jgi:Fe(3+) dicitrate transport protein